MTKSTNLDSQTDPQSANNNHSPSTQPSTQPSIQPSIASAEEGASAAEGSLLEKGQSSPINRTVGPLHSSASAVAAIIDSKPLPPSAQRRKIRRNGRVAGLPRIQRDMINRMLWNAVPYKNIVAALDDAGFTVTERNISNWATGGHLEWRLAQEHVLENRLDQDHLLDFLRRNDAP